MGHPQCVYPKGYPPGGLYVEVPASLMASMPPSSVSKGVVLIAFTAPPAAAARENEAALTLSGNSMIETRSYSPKV